MMNDTQEPAAQQKKEYTFKALILSGFERVNEMEIFTKEHDGDMRVIADLTAGTSVYFKNGTERIDQDDEQQTLNNVYGLIKEAEDGRMPTISEPSEVVNVPKKGDTPPPESNEPEVFDPPELAQDTTDKEFVAELGGILDEVDPSKQTGTPSTEIVRSTAPPAAFVPQGTMIKNLVPGLKEIGKIKIGRKGEMRKSKQGNEYRPPEKFNHFEVVTLYKDEIGDFIPDATIMGLIGDGAKELEISLLYNDPSLNFYTGYAEYKGGKRLCHGDGETAIDPTGKKIKCDINTCQKYANKKCKLNGVLSVILKASPQLGGVYKFRTTSINSVRSIMSSMFFIQSLTGGVLANIPLKMTIAPMSVNPVGSATAQTIYVVNLIYPGNVDDLRKQTLQLMTEQAGMHSKMIELEAQARAAISAPETKEEIQDVESEFYPDTVKEEAT